MSIHITTTHGTLQAALPKRLLHTEKSGPAFAATSPQSAPTKVMVIDLAGRTKCCKAYTSCDEYGVEYCKVCFEEVTR